MLKVGFPKGGATGATGPSGTGATGPTGPTGPAGGSGDFEGTVTTTTSIEVATIYSPAATTPGTGGTIWATLQSRVVDPAGGATTIGDIYSSVWMLTYRNVGGVVTFSGPTLVAQERVSADASFTNFLTALSPGSNVIELQCRASDTSEGSDALVCENQINGSNIPV
jgi:hypothetical protein